MFARSTHSLAFINKECSPKVCFKHTLSFVYPLSSSEKVKVIVETLYRRLWFLVTRGLDRKAVLAFIYVVKKPSNMPISHLLCAEKSCYTPSNLI